MNKFLIINICILLSVSSCSKIEDMKREQEVQEQEYLMTKFNHQMILNKVNDDYEMIQIIESILTKNIPEKQQREFLSKIFKGIENNNSNAMLAMAIVHQEGFADYPPNKEKMIEWLNKSSQAGNQQATDILAKMEAEEQRNREVQAEQERLERERQLQLEMEQQAQKAQMEHIVSSVAVKYVEENGHQLLNSAYQLAFNALKFQNASLMRSEQLSDGGYNVDVKLNYLNLLDIPHYLIISFKFNDTGNLKDVSYTGYSDVIAPNALTFSTVAQALNNQLQKQ